jgi:hypothetical protein
MLKDIAKSPVQCAGRSLWARSSNEPGTGISRKQKTGAKGLFLEQAAPVSPQVYSRGESMRGTSFADSRTQQRFPVAMICNLVRASDERNFAVERTACRDLVGHS